MKTIAILISAIFASISITDPPLPLWSRFGEDVTIDNPVNGDVYVAGQKVTINAPVRGDLVVTGGTVTINDTVTMDVLVAGGTVTINGFVGDDIRCAGGEVVVAGGVNGDAMVTSGEFSLKRDADVNGNLIAYAGVVGIDGIVLGNVSVTGGDVKIPGVVNGAVDLKAEKIKIEGTVKGSATIAANTITVAPTAQFNKDIKFWNESGSLTIPSDVAHGEVVFEPALEIKSGRWELLGFASVLMLLWYLGTAFVMIWVIEYLFSNTFKNAAKVALNNTGSSFGYGALFFIAIPVLCVFLAITVLAIPLAVILLIAYAILAVFATAITAIIISNWLNHVYYRSEWSVLKLAMVSFGIFVFLKLFTLTPIIGPVIMIIAACMSFGAILISVRSGLSKLNSNAQHSTSQPSQALQV